MSQVQIISGVERRRRWNEEEKRALVAEAFAPGAVVLDVARRADISPTLLYRWRRELTGSRLAAVVLTSPAEPSAEAAAPAASSLDIDLGGGIHVRIGASVPAALAAAVVKVLARR